MGTLVKRVTSYACWIIVLDIRASHSLVIRQHAIEKI